MNSYKDIKLVVANSTQAFNDGRKLFQEYANAIDYEAGFPNFAEELATLENIYVGPLGSLVLAYYHHQAIGCLAVLEIENDTAELKRFYVQPPFRQFKIGARLLEFTLDQAKQLQFQRVRLEVIPSLGKAKELYRSFGFEEITPFRNVSVEGTTYMEKDLGNKK